jgi:sirohydrochlorin ferrochelatase
MTIALVDNGSLEADAHRNLRAVAATLAARAGQPVAAVSWKHSDRVDPAALDGIPAAVLAPWLRARFAAGEREFVFVPFFVSAQGAIGSALRADLEKLQSHLGAFAFSFTASLATAGQGGVSALSRIVADRLSQVILEQSLSAPAVIVVDHGGPAPASAALRNAAAAEVRQELGGAIGPLAAASMESPEGPDFGFNRPLLADQLRAPGYDRGPVVIAPLFLSPGRHAGPAGDLAAIARAAETAQPGLRCHFSGLIGTHPQAAEALAEALGRHLASRGSLTQP